jgi:hypothetical protein
MKRKTRMGRPPIKGPKLSKLIAVRFKPGELRELRRAAPRGSLSEWAREVLLKDARRKLAKGD